MKRTTKAILLSTATIAMSASLIAGATFALFTSESSTNIAINAGKVKVIAEVENLKTYSAVWSDESSSYVSTPTEEIEGGENGKFTNSGTAEYADEKVNIDRITPGDAVEFDIKVTNESTVAIKYQTQITTLSGDELLSALTVTIGDTELKTSGTTVASAWSEPVAPNSEIDDIRVKIELPWQANDDYQGESCELAVTLYAVQGNAHTTDPVEEEDPDTTYIYNETQLLQFAQATATSNYAGKTVMLMNDIYLSNDWTPMSTETGMEFKGTFNGNGQTIHGLKAEGDKYVGFFGKATYNAVIENVTFSDVTLKGENYIGTVAGNAFGSVTIKDVHVTGNIAIEGHYDVAGLVGYIYGKIEGCSVEGAAGSYVKGTYDREDYEGDNVGGLVGYMGEGGNSTVYVLNDCSVSGVTVSGTRKVGGVIGYLEKGKGVSGSTFSGTVECNAQGEYATKNAHRLAVGGIVGEATNYAGIKNCEVKNATINALYTYSHEKTDGTKIDSKILGNVRDGADVNTIEYDGNTVTNSTTNAIAKNVVWDKNTPAMGSKSYVKSLDLEDANDLLNFATMDKSLLRNGVGHDWRTTVNITADIDLSGKTWVPIAGYTDFEIDGHDHTISNIDMGNTSAARAGFIGYAQDAAIRNLTLENVTVAGGQVAIVAGTWSGGAHAGISNVTIAGTNSVKYDATAGDYGAPGVGVFVGHYSEGQLPVEALAIADGAEITLEVTDMPSDIAYAHTISEFYYFGYCYNNTVDPGKDKVTKSASAKIIVIGVDAKEVSTDELDEALANAHYGDTFVITEGESYELSSSWTIPAGVTIAGNEENPVELIVPAGGTTIKASDVTLKNMEINGTAVSKNVLSIDKSCTGTITLEDITITGGGQTTWDCSVVVYGSANIVIRNSKISDGAFRTVMTYGSGDILIEQCEIDSVYIVNVNGGTGFLTVKDSVLHGWTSYGTASAGARFENVTFTMGDSGYNFVRGYTDTEFVNCTFGKDFSFGAANTKMSVTFEGCKWVDGTAIDESILNSTDNANTTWTIK